MFVRWTSIPYLDSDAYLQVAKILATEVLEVLHPAAQA
jgi:hypothetical protein